MLRRATSIGLLRVSEVQEPRSTHNPATLGSAGARVVPVRLDPELDQTLQHRTETDNSTTSDVIRDALRAWLKTAEVG